jgi:hypothetical protein
MKSWPTKKDIGQWKDFLLWRRNDAFLEKLLDPGADIHHGR